MNAVIISFNKNKRKPIRIDKKRTLKKFSFLLNLPAKPITTKPIITKKNGFNISDEDLKLRGPGEFFGTKQHGYLKSGLSDFYNDGPIIRNARSPYANILEESRIRY